MPTPAQIEAGNYRMQHRRVHGLDISIETPKGATRRGTGAGGKPWSVKMPAHYGYVRGTEGADGDHVDVYLGPNPLSGRVFVVDQIDPETGDFDEHKAILGCGSQQEACGLYDRGFSDGLGQKRRGAVTAMDVGEFKDWLQRGKTKKPLALASGGAVSRADGGEVASYFDEIAAPAKPNAVAAVAPKSGGSYFDEMLSPPSSVAPPAVVDPYAKARALWTSNQPPELVQDDERAAGIGTTALSSFPVGLDAQMRVFAKARGVPVERYRVIDGQIAYQEDDGKWYAEVPRHWNPEAIARRAAAGVGPSIAPVAGATAGIATSPMALAGPAGLATSMLTTGAVTGAADALRQLGADIVSDEQKSPMRTAVETGKAALAQGAGAGLSAWSQRYQVPDVSRIDPAEVDKIRAKARAEGIPLTPAEETNLASLKAQQKWLGNATRSQNILQEFYEGRNEKVSAAINRFLGRLSGVDSAEVAGEMGRKAAGKAVDAATAARAAKASPLYRQSFATEPLPWSGTLESLMKRPSMKEAWTRAQRIAAEREIELPKMFIEDAKGALTLNTKVVPDWQTLHYMKVGLDDLISSAGAKDSSYGNITKSAVKSTQRALLDYMDAGNPTYQQARRIYADLSPGVTKVKEGMVGRMADAGETQLGGLARTLFGGNSGPVAIKQARDAISKADPEAWGALKRAWVQDIFEKSAQEYASNYGSVSNLAGKFAAATRGNTQTLARMKAALSPEEFTAFNNLTDVLRAASRVKPIGSDTEFNRLITQEMTAQSRGVLSKIAANLNPIEAVKNFDAWLTNRNMGQLSETLANTITQPGATEKLRQIKQLPVGSIRWRAAIGHLLTQGAAAGLGMLDDDAEAAAVNRKISGRP